jgi:DNA-binding response OmpR family regulator
MASERPTILVVEDDATLVLGLEINLRAEGFRVLSARDGQTGLRMGLEQNPDLAVLDLGLPGMDGLDVLAEWRRRGRELPVIVLTARATLDDKVLGLGQGADDYLTKTFRIKELTARIRAALRRAGLGRGPRRVQLGEVEVDLDARRVSRAGAEMALTAKEFDLLAFLIERPGRVFSRERLLEAVWGMDYDGTDRTVDNFVRSLRVKVEADPAEPRHVVTVRGAGYRFEA